MKRKLLSCILSLVLIFTMVYMGIPTVLAENENLITNGDFSSYSGNTPTGWRFDLPTTNSFSYEIVKNVQIPNGPKTNAMKFTSSETHIKLNDNGQYVAYDAQGYDSRMYFSGTETIRIEKNATYTMTFWAKTVKTHALTCMMFEPNYVIPAIKSSVKYGVEGHNLYTYKTTYSSLRNSRPEINHVWTVAQSGEDVSNYPSSMFISRYAGTGRDEDRWIYMYEQPLTPDFPKYEKQGEWVKVVYTFSTDNLDEHEADVAFTFRFPQVKGGEVWLADLQMTVQKAKIDGYYTPTNKTPELGAVSKNLALPQGKTIKITAEPFGENKFDGWYNGDTLVTKDATYSFTYDPLNPPAYEARFTKAKWGINGSLEDLATGKVASVGYSSASAWTANSFKADTNGAIYVDSVNAGSSNSVSIVEDAAKAHTGTKVAKYTGKNGYVGYKFTGFNKNTSYYLSTYASVVSDDVNDTVAGVYVTDANSGVTKLVSGAVQYKTATDTGVRYYSNVEVECNGTWKKIEVTVDTGDSTDVILWIGSPASGKDLYLDNFAVAREPYKFEPKSSDYNLGFVSPIGGADAYENEDVTVTATPLDGNGFDGWYIGNQLVSSALSYTHKFNPEDTGLANLTAKFVPGPYAIPGAGFEGLGYTNNQVLVTHTNGYLRANGETCDQSDLTNNGDWSVDSLHDGTWQRVSADTTFAHTGTTSVKLDCRNGWGGYTIKGLQPYSNYSVSLYAWAFDNKASTVNGLNQVIVTNAGERPIHKTTSGWTNRNYTNALGGIRSVVDCREGWTKVTGSFKTTDKGDVTVWFNVFGDGSQRLHIDNIAVFESVEVKVAQTVGGTIKTNLSNNNDVPVGSYVELKAFPLEGNSFDGWYDSKTNELISSNLSYNFNVSGPISLIAKFSGDNMPPTDILPLQGMDGTIENGRINGWWADDPVHTDVTWCRWERSTEMAYEGSYSLKGFCRHRYTNLTFNNLAKNTNYCLTMYVNPTGAAQNDQTEDYTRIEEYGIIGPDERYLEGATDVLVRQGPLKGNNGWQRLDLCFNTGDRTYVTFSAKLIGWDGALCYYDNISLYQYNSTEPIKNPGNVDGDIDGKVDLDDVVVLAQIVAGWNSVNFSQAHLDVSGDREVSLDDVVLLAQYVADWGSELSNRFYNP